MITEDDEFERIEREQKMRLDLARDAMTDLTKIMEEMRQMMKDACEPITLKPTKLLIQPAALTELGLTVDDVKNMNRDNQ
jgi:hypothetical protein